MKALSLIWSHLGIDLRSALMSISLNVILTRRFSIHLQLSYELSTGWHELITTAQFCAALSEGLDTLAGWFIHLFYFTIELLFTTKGKWNHLFLFNRKTSKFTFSTEDIELEQVSWYLGLQKIFSHHHRRGGEVECCVMIARKPQSSSLVISVQSSRCPVLPGYSRGVSNKFNKFYKYKLDYLYLDWKR